MHRRALFLNQRGFVKYLSFYMKFNGNILDSSYNPINLTSSNNQYVASSLRQAKVFTSLSDRVIAPLGQSNISKIQLATATADEKFSINVRLKATAISTNQSLIMGRYLIDGEYEYMFSILPNRRLIFRKWSLGSGANYTQCVCDLQLTLGTYYNIAYVDDGVNRRFYINGQLQTATIINVGTYVRMSPIGGITFSIGGATSGVSSDSLFMGEIDDLAIYKNKILSQDEISWLNNSGSGREIR